VLPECPPCGRAIDGVRVRIIAGPEVIGKGDPVKSLWDAPVDLVGLLKAVLGERQGSDVALSAKVHIVTGVVHRILRSLRPVAWGRASRHNVAGGWEVAISRRRPRSSVT
jgi:hypothetical protein